MNTSQNTTPKFKANLDVYKIPYGDPEWYKFRTVGIPSYSGGVGASEIGKLIPGIDKYRPCLPEIFAHKVGYETPQDISNIAIYKGQMLEPVIRDVWSFWQGNAQEENIQAMKDYLSFVKDPSFPRKRTYKVYGHYLVNPKYKYLFCSLDALINAGEPNVYGEVLEHDAPLEVKTIGYWGAQQWELRIPPKYTVQVDQQMIITESDYAELVMWEDGIIRVYVFQANENTKKRILHLAYEFWTRVMKARELYALIPKYHGDVNAVNQIWGEIQKLEPDPDDSEGYTEYMKERMNGVDVVKGSPSAYRAARNYAKVRALENAIAKQKNLWRNVLLSEMHKSGAAALEFDKYGKVNTGKTFTVKIKPEPDEQMINEELRKIISIV